MKKSYLKLKQWLLVTLGLGLTASSCKSGVPPQPEPVCMYGVPEATYHLQGTVRNEKGAPVEGIGVGSYYARDNGTSGYVDTTDADGHYKVTVRHFSPGENIPLDFRDIDGWEHGGYHDTVVEIETRGVPLTGGGGWYCGEGTVTQDVVLTERTPVEE